MPDIFVAKPEEKKQRFSGRRTPGFLAAFIPRPRNLKFETQEPKEKIVLLLRRHPITNLPWVGLVILLIFIPFLLGGIIPWNSFPSGYQLILLLVWYLFVFAFVFERFLIWFFNVNILTDERIIDISFPTLLFRQIAQTKIDKIQNVSIKTGGYIRSLFNFGDVLIQSAEAIPQIVFEAVPNPEKVSQIINDLLLEEEREKIEGRVR